MLLKGQFNQKMYSVIIYFYVFYLCVTEIWEIILGFWIYREKNLVEESRTCLEFHEGD